MFNRLQSERLLFVWDGMKRSVRIADEVLESHGKMTVSCLRVLPHESAYAYTTCGHCEHEPMGYEQKIHSLFQKQVSSSKHLKHRKLELVFGEQVVEIARYAKITHATSLLIPKFKQSMFSNWIHGDLNHRITEKVDCEILFYDTDSEAPQVDARSSNRKKDNSDK